MGMHVLEAFCPRHVHVHKSICALTLPHVSSLVLHGPIPFVVPLEPCMPLVTTASHTRSHQCLLAAPCPGFPGVFEGGGCCPGQLDHDLVLLLI